MALAVLAAPLLLSAYNPGPIVVTRVDPLTVDDDDFARHRDPADWTGLSVDDIAFDEERARWHLFRITKPGHRNGPLWFVPHDNENAGFEAGLVALRRYGGTMIVVDSDARRRNAAVAFGPAIDPNRNFHDGLPRYPSQVLASINHGGWPIIALHTNAPGYDSTDSLCPKEGDTSGTGIISIRYCDTVLRPRASVSRAYPFDDDDSVAFATYLATQQPDDAFCAPQMKAADYNIVFERVVGSDGSLSNYAVTHHLAYLNFETRNLGDDPADLASGRDRLTWMIDHSLAMCAGQRPGKLPLLRFR
ncbi:hypothetical protein [Sphingomonas oligophenolica]|uniref:Uncharacterized protein n=1 Tax=Sphingomonas oligophenolica TaxID=301154 RepID=A0A502CLR1_9SPHN|nr:hypothetical protein [Sphingomonas oligophenolica]TPG12706.1 hypothetical protein EAH84_07960 [Sphingomonas oligophenolica]